MMNGSLKVFAGRSHPELATEICRHLAIPLGNSHVVRFSNENLMVQIDENVRGADVYVIQTSAPPVNEGIIELLIMIDALKHASAGPPWSASAVTWHDLRSLRIACHGAPTASSSCR